MPASFETYFAPMGKYFQVSVFSPAPGQFATIFNDITQHVQMEKAAQEKESYYRSLIHSLQEDIVVIDRDYHVVDVNNSFLVTIGRQREEVIGRFCYEVSGCGVPCDQHGRRCPLGEVFETGEPRRYHHVHVNADGSCAHRDTLLSPLKDQDGRVVYVVEAVRDASDQVRAQEALQKSEDRYQGLFDNVPIGIYRTAPDGRILAANSALVQMLGYPNREALLQANAHDLYANPGDRQRQLMQITAAPEGIMHGFEMQLFRYDGSLIWVRDTFRAIYDSQGQLLYYEGSLEDITKQKQLEAQFLQAQKMEAIGRLAGGVAHDFNNYLTTIISYADFLLADLAPDDPRRADAEEIRKAGERAAALTRQLLAFSRKQVIQPEVINLNEIIGSLEKMLCRLI
ncbi:MAG: PAS domain S-box protein, partial [Chloroflexi bacterium]|nr:PAS domain S-box protein [Chloroflexota bacterium]